jgi:glycosyltransferase involved in cell wall biosynthesis
MCKPLISVIISTYNSEKFLRGRLDNLIGQTIFDKLEIIIVNSGSMQGEREIVREYTRRYENIKYIETEERETIYAAWNRGIQIATGKFITNANTDDRLKSNALEILAKILEANSKVGVVYADQYITNIPNADFSCLKFVGRHIRPRYNKLLYFDACYTGSQPMWRAAIHKEYNIMFDGKYEVAGDYDFFCRALDVFEMMLVPKFLGVYYLSDKKTNKEFSNLKQTVGEALSVQEKYTRAYFEKIGIKSRMLLLKRFLIILKIPSILYGAIYRLFAIYPRWSLISRMMITYYVSVIYECDRKYENALSVCDYYKDKDYAQLIRRQIARLTSIKEDV